jgi:hypothetical protein
VRGRDNPYYDDPHMMGMEGDYTVVDYTQPSTSADINNPNVDKTLAIVDNTPRYSVEETSIFVEERVGPVSLGRDQQLQVLNLLEAGEIVSIELVTDNPYISLYIEMDDYKYKTPNGMTAAELLLRGRDEYSERHFYVEDRRPDGMYVIKFHPRTDNKYTDRLKILVRNDITKPTQFRGLQYDYNARASVPSPLTIGFNGGSSARVPGLSSIITHAHDFVLGSIIAKGINVEFSEGATTNDRFRITPNTLAGASHPFVGTAGKVPHKTLNSHIASTTFRAKWGEPGVAVTSEGAASDNLETTPFPGQPFGDLTGIAAPGGPKDSTQQLIIYDSNAESATAAGGVAMSQLMSAIYDAKANGDSFYYTVGDTIYYPGQLANLQYYDDGDSQFVEVTNSTSYAPADDGALLLTFKPGFDFVPPKADLSETSFDTFGHLALGSMAFEVLVQEVSVKRKKKKVLN